MFGGNFAPSGWAFCNGQLLPISEYDALFNLIGTTYGGDGQETFALPNLQSRVPFHQGPSFVIGQMSGSETVTLTVQQVPAHSHVPTCRAAGSDSPNPANAVWGAASDSQYAAAPPDTSMNPAALSSIGGKDRKK